MYLCRKCGSNDVHLDINSNDNWCASCQHNKVKYVLEPDFFDSDNDYPDIEPSFNRKR